MFGDEHNIVSFCEIDPFCQKVLKKHWPDVPIIDDIRDVTYERIVCNSDSREYDGWVNKKSRGSGRKKSCRGEEKKGAFWEHAIASGNKIRRTGTNIDLLTGGFPCQPFSVAGKQRSKEDDRYLWKEMLAVIREIRPTWVIGENVAGIINLALDKVLSDMEDSQYEVQPFLIPACGKDAPHRRDRVWIVGNANEQRSQGFGELRECSGERVAWENGQDVADTEGGKSGEQTKQEGREDIGRGSTKINGTSWLPESRLGRMAPGLSDWLDEPDIPRVATGVKNRVDRLKSLGNAIVPNCVEPIMQAIKAIG